MGLEQGNETGGEVQSGQAPSTGVAPSQTPTATPSQQQTATPWKVRIGDSEYDESTWKTKGVEDFKKFHGEYTRSRQELSQLRDASGAGLELLELVKQDPQLLAEVRRRMAKGQSPEQAVQGATQNDPRIDQMAQRLDSMEQNEASSAFRAKHPDLNDEDIGYITNWLGENTEWLRGSGRNYHQILDLAYNDLFVNKKSKDVATSALAEGQRMTEEAIKKGQKGQLVGAPSPTAQTREKVKKPTINMNPAERQAHALEKYKANAKKG